MLESLEGRVLLALMVSIDKGVLLVRGTSGADVITADLVDSAVVVKINAATFGVPAGDVKGIVVQAGGGNDRVTVGPTVDAWSQLSGGEGNDFLRAGQRAGKLSGDSGHDTLGGGASRDVLVGGPGIDTADYSGRSENLVIVLDGKPNDGLPGKKKVAERDNVAADIENVLGGSGNDLIVGSAGKNTLQGGPGDDSVRGMGGDDILVGGQGADKVEGGDGDDVLMGIDSSTEDHLDGGGGFDVVAYDSIAGITDALSNVENEVSVLLV